MDKKHRVLVVDDSAVARIMINRGLNAHPNIEVVDAAASTKLSELKPDRLATVDLIVCDLDAARMTALELQRALPVKKSYPVIAVSPIDLSGVSLISKGVAGFVQKPLTPQDTPAFLKKLSSKIATLCEAASANQRPGFFPTLNPIPAIIPLGDKSALDHTIICLGASTGGTEATLQVLKELPGDLPPLVVVQHMPTGFTKMYAQRLDRCCEMSVEEGVDGTILQRGHVYVAPAGFQTRVMQRGPSMVLSCIPGQKVSGHCPSVDVAFASVAELTVRHKVGVILTGMGRDGAREMLTLRRKGAYTIGQNKESCVVYGMPMEAYLLGGVQIEAACEKIPEVILNYLRKL